MYPSSIKNSVGDEEKGEEEEKEEEEDETALVVSWELDGGATCLLCIGGIGGGRLTPHEPRVGNSKDGVMVGSR